jgi:hypothetical protein
MDSSGSMDPLIPNPDQDPGRSKWHTKITKNLKILSLEEVHVISDRLYRLYLELGSLSWSSKRK